MSSRVGSSRVPTIVDYCRFDSSHSNISWVSKSIHLIRIALSSTSLKFFWFSIKLFESFLHTVFKWNPIRSEKYENVFQFFQFYWESFVIDCCVELKMMSNRNLFYEQSSQMNFLRNGSRLSRIYSYRRFGIGSVFNNDSGSDRKKSKMKNIRKPRENNRSKNAFGLWNRLANNTTAVTLYSTLRITQCRIFELVSLERYVWTNYLIINNLLESDIY